MVRSAMYPVLALVFFLTPNLAAMPAEKRAQMCFTMQTALNPQTPIWWKAGKIGISAITGVAAALFVGYLDTTPQTPSPKIERFNRLISAYNAINTVRAKFDPTTTNPTFTAPHIPTSPTLLQVATFLATGVVAYYLLTLTADKIGKPYTTALKTFLNDWPDYAFYAPQTMREEAGALYGAYLRDEVDALMNEQTAQLILLAFDVFLTEEIQSISQAL